ncbi:MAG: hypothetical protein C4330_01040 [Chitinophagaceae bacterium]
MRNRSTIKYWLRRGILFIFVFLQLQFLYAQNDFMMRNGRMYLRINKKSTEQELNNFIADFDLKDLNLKDFIKSNNLATLQKLGWKIEQNTESIAIISKKLEAAEGMNNSAKRITINNKSDPIPVCDIRFGINKFRNKIFTVDGNTVTFFLKNNTNARKVMLAGSFNNWSPGALPMKKTADGWIAQVNLKPGKWYYIFIIDDQWSIDTDNYQRENDGQGNINSVYYMTNTLFVCNGFTDARKVFLAGSFNNWNQKELPMTKVSKGWILAMYLPEGTHTYKFVVDGNWYEDAGVKEKLPDGAGGYNSVIRFGKPYLFKLNGFTNARQVVLSGSFNSWREDELYLAKTATGWELPYTLGAGNYEYKFIIDGKWMSDPASVLSSTVSGNSFLIIEPNYTFRLKGYKNAKRVFLAGDFNNWDPQAYAMKKEGDDWVFPVHLGIGKHLYKFFVDGDWIRDPNNKLWEQNEFGTGNSVVWIEK